MTKTPEQMAQEYKAQDMAKGNGAYFNSGRIPAFLAGHAAGKQEECERIWAEIENNWQGTSWRTLVKRIIFGGK